MVTADRHAAPFSRIDAGYGIGVTVQVGPATSIKVEAQQNLLPIIETRGTIFLPFVWLLLESIEPVATKQAARSVRPAELAQGHA